MKAKYTFLVMGLLLACSQGEPLEQKKAKLDQLKNELVNLKEEIMALETDILASDPEFTPSDGQHSLVSTMVVEPQPFEHKFEVRAAVASRKNVQISAEALGRIESIYVREGDRVKKGQTLLSMDASILVNSISELQTNLTLANTVYEKRERLWQQNIGSEIQYLEAKNQKESLEGRLATSQAQLSQYRVSAPFSGVVDAVQAKAGEMAQPGLPLLRILSEQEMHLEADVSENYLGRISRGDSVEIYFPSFDRKLRSVVAAIGQVINPQNRTFSVEVALPASDFSYKPNMVAVLKVRDYYQAQSLVVPSELIQQDNLGNFLFLLSADSGEHKAAKKHITLGRTYEIHTEVLEGLEPGSVIIKGGHREVTDGAVVKLAERETL